MNRKILSLGVFVFLALALMINFASATITISNVQNPSVYGNNFNVTFSSDQTETVTLKVAPITENGITITFTDVVVPVTAGATNIATIPYNTNNFNFNYVKTYSTTLNATNGTDVVQSTVTFAPRPFCDNIANNGGLRTEITEITTLSGFGDDDDVWYPLDEVEIEVNVDNQGSWDVRSVEVKWALYTTAGIKVADDELSSFKLDEGDEKTLTFTITLDENIDDFDGEDVVLYVKATGKIDDSSSTYDDDATCDSDSNTISVTTDDNFVILRDIIMNAETLDNKELSLNTALTCGDEVTITADVWNIQNSDEDEVSVEIYNKELGIDETIEVGDINAFDSEVLNAQIKIPENAAEKWYVLYFSVYDEDHDLYENGEDVTSEYSIKIKVENCTNNLAPSLSAQLVSEAIAGKDLVIKTIITNTGSEARTYNLNVAGYSDWAVLKEISDSAITLNAGEAKEVQIIFDTTRTSAGDRFFDIEVLSDGQIVVKQPVAVSISERGIGSGFSDFIVSNWKLLGIILLNLILVIAIIVVIVRLYRK